MEGQTWPDPNSGGINDAFDKFFDPQQEEGASSPNGAAQEASKETSGTTTQKEEPKPSDGKKAVEIKEIKIDDEFSVGVEEKKVDIEEKPKGEFDEAAFDKETEEATKGMEAKAGEKFKALRTELKEAKQKTVTPDIEKKISDLELKAAEADGLRQRMEELSLQSSKIRVETSEDFDREVRKPVDALYSKAEELATLYEGDAKLLWAIITERDRKTQNEMVKEHLGEFSDLDRSDVYGMSRDFGKLVEKRNEMLSDADRYIQKMELEKVRQAEKAMEDNKKAVQTYQRDMWNKYKNVIPGFVDEDGKETADFKALMNRSMSLDITKAPPRDQAFSVFSGVILKHMVGQINILRQQIAEYESGDEKAIKSRPNIGGSVNATATERPEMKGQTFVQRFAEADLV